MQNWLITGCSTGLGRALALAVLERGWSATITARNPSDLEDLAAKTEPGRCLTQRLDVTDTKQIHEVVSRSEERFGSVDVLVNNAGFGFRAAVEEADAKDLRELFETNFFGLVRLTQAVLPGMRARRRGYVVNISSVAGRLAQAGNGLYSASKFAVEGMSDGLRKELQPLGIQVMLVEPGPFRTDFAGRSLRQSSRPIKDYAATAGLLRKEKSSIHGTQPGDPAQAAQCIIRAMDNDKPPFRLVLGRLASERVEIELKEQLQELKEWKQTAAEADFPANQVIS
jgi:NAD(P)-dependent dehydrogenase (short-subunit alcohol dehydrogenase family)